MAPQSHSFSPENMRDALVTYFRGELESSTKFNVLSWKLQCCIDELNKVNELRKLSNQEVLLQNSERKQIYRWATKYGGYFNKDRAIERQNFTLLELKNYLISVIKKQRKYVIQEKNMESQRQQGIDT